MLVSLALLEALEDEFGMDHKLSLSYARLIQLSDDFAVACEDEDEPSQREITIDSERAGVAFTMLVDGLSRTELAAYNQVISAVLD